MRCGPAAQLTISNFSLADSDSLKFKRISVFATNSLSLNYEKKKGPEAEAPRPEMWRLTPLIIHELTAWRASVRDTTLRRAQFLRRPIERT